MEGKHKTPVLVSKGIDTYTVECPCCKASLSVNVERKIPKVLECCCDVCTNDEPCCRCGIYYGQRDEACPICGQEHYK